MNNIVADKYEILEVLGQGAMSTVYKAVDKETENIFAVKELTLNTDEESEKEAILRFRREAQVVSQLYHPNIQKIHEIFQQKDKFYLVLEYFNGIDLKNSYEYFTLQEKIEIISYCAAALIHIHEKGIVHRDIKPANILVKKTNENIQVKLIDFGLAYLQNFQDVFEEGTIVGSLAYIAPEQTGLLRRAIDNRSDLYSLGATFYELLTGKAPFADIELSKIIHKHLASKPTNPSELNHIIPPIIDEIVLKLLSKEPDERYQSAKGLKADLDYFLLSPEKESFAIALKDRKEKLNFQIKAVGRETELSLLAEYYNSCNKLLPQMIFVTGEQGVGKTKLFEEFFEQNSGDENTLFFTYSCSIQMKNVPFAPFTNFIRNYFRYGLKNEQLPKIEEILGRGLNIISKTFPILKKYFSLNQEIENGFKKLNLFRALTYFFIQMGNFGKRIVFFIDELDNADKDTIELINYLALNLEETRFMFIITLSDDELYKNYMKNILSESKITHLIYLNTLGKEALYNFINRVFSFESVYKEEFYDFIYKHSIGNPSHIFEILKALYEHRVIYNDDYSWKIDYEELREFNFEIDLSKLSFKKLSYFNKEERAILSNASILGTDFSTMELNELVFRQTGKNDLNKIVTVIDKARNYHLLEKDFNATQSYYSFKNNKIYKIIYKNIDKKYKEKLHFYCAEMYEQKFKNKIQDNVYKIAYHYNRSCKKEKQFYYNKIAYKDAISNQSLNEAVYYMELVIKYYIENNVYELETVELINDFSKYLILAGRISHAIEYLKYALKILEQKDIEKDSINIYLRIGNAYYYLNDTNNAFDYFNKAIVIAEKYSLDIKDGVPYLLLGSAFLFTYQLMEAEINFTKAIEYFDENDYENNLPAYGLRSWTYIFLGEFDKVRNDIQIIESNIHFIENELTVTQLLNYMSYYYLYTGEDLDLGLKYSLTAHEFAVKNGNVMYQFATHISRMVAYLFKNEYEKALEAGQKCIKISNDKKIFIGIRNAYATVALTHIYNKNFVKADEIAEENLKKKHVINNDKYSAIIFYIVKALYFYYINENEQALEFINKADEIFKLSEIKLLKPLVYSVISFIYVNSGFKKQSDEILHELNVFMENNEYFDFYLSRIELMLNIVQEERDKRIKLNSIKDTNIITTSSTFIKEKLQLDNIIKTSQKISSILDIDELLNVIVDKTLEVTGAERAALLLANKETGQLEYKITRAPSIKGDSEKGFIVPNSVIQEVEAKKKGVVISVSDEKIQKQEISTIILEHGIKSIICAPLIYEDKLIGIIYLDSKLLKFLFSHEDLKLLNVFASQAAISLVNAEKNAIIKKQFSDSIQIIYSLIANNTSRVHENTQTVRNMSVMLAKKIGLNYSEVEKIRVAAILRDVGIISLMDKLLYSPKAITDEEKEIVHKHPQKSVEIINHIQGIEDIKEIILQHEERFDGSGYPNGIKSNEILIGARIIGLIDDFVLMLRSRKFQTKDKNEKIINELESKKGTLYDPEITHAFIELIKEFNLIYIVKEQDIEEIRNANVTEWHIPSNVNFEPIIVQKIMDELTSRLDIAPELAFSIDFSLCEVIRNAIIHGNKYIENKKVSIKVKILDMDVFAKKLTITVTDQGEGMDIEEHQRFADSRNKLFSVINKLKNYKVNNENLVNDPELEGIIRDLSLFKLDYYTDFNTFRQLEGSDVSGGVGLLQVKNTFDSVEFNNIIKGNKICGLSVVMEKFIE